MAVADVDTNSHVLVTWTEASFSDISTDPDNALGGGIDNGGTYTNGTLVEMTAESGLGVWPVPDPIRNRMMTDRQLSPKARAGRLGGQADFGVRAISGDTALTTGGTPTGGPYKSLIDAAFGLPMTAAAETFAASTTNTTTTDLTLATNYAVGMICSIVDVDGAVFDIRQIVDVSTNTVTWNRALSFTSTENDLVRPLLTYRPHAVPFAHPTMYIKRRVRDSGAVDGQALDFSGVGLTMVFETPEVGQEPVFHFTGSADDWATKSAEDPDFSSAIITDLPPLIVESRLFLNDTAIEAARVSIDPRTSLTERSSFSGNQGRSGWDHMADVNGPIWTVDVLYDQDHYAAYKAETLYPMELLIGPNSMGDTVANDHGYFAFFTPAAQITNIEEVTEDHLKYHRLTIEGVRSETSGRNTMYPLAFGIPGTWTI